MVWSSFPRPSRAKNSGWTGIVAADGSEDLLEHGLPLVGFEQFDLGADQVDVRRHHLKIVHLGLYQSVGDADAAYHRLVERALLVVVGREVQSGSGVRLRIGVDDQDLLLKNGEGSRQIDGGGGLAHSSLLICYCYYFSHKYQVYKFRKILFQKPAPDFAFC